MYANRGFSLVELSIVLVILGLLVGGVMSGQSLIKAAELRSITTSYNQYQAAVNTFRDKYMALPGDMPNATAFWDSVSGACGTTQGTGTQTCDGDGNGMINNENHGPNHETFRAWQHLTNAGLIPGNYAGYYPTSPCSSSVCWVPGMNAPTHSIGGSVWTLRFIEAGDSWAGKQKARHVISFGKTGTSGRWHDKILNPEDVYAIEMKMDDGRPFTGSLVMMTNYSSGCFDGSQFSADATYNLDDPTISCVLLFDGGW